MSETIFQNKRTKFVTTDDCAPHWRAIDQVGKASTLADFREFIAKLIAEHGENTKFYVDSDGGDEFFILER